MGGADRNSAARDASDRATKRRAGRFRLRALLGPGAPARWHETETSVLLLPPLEETVQDLVDHRRFLSGRWRR